MDQIELDRINLIKKGSSVIFFSDDILIQNQERLIFEDIEEGEGEEELFLLNNYAVFSQYTSNRTYKS